MADHNEPSTSQGASGASVIKNPSGKIVRSGQRLMAYNVYLKHKNKLSTKTEAVKLTAADVGVSEKLVFKIIAEMDKLGVLKSPSKKRKREDFYSKLTEDEKKAVRYAVHSFFKRNEIPTVDKILKAVEENPLISNMARTTLFKVLKKLGFVWEKRDRNSMLIERDDIILWRRRYLTKILKYRQEGRVVYYLDETWVNAGHTKAKIWKDKSVKNTRQAFVDDLSVGLRDPSEKGHRYIITHIGNENGFVEGGLLLFESKKSGDYHEDMNSIVFEEWMTKILPALAENCVIVMDNAPYHSVKVEKTPITAWKKNEIKMFLQQKGVEVHEHMLKIELKDLAMSYVTRNPIPYKVDEMVRLTNREVLRLPPYHCKLNPIELVWAQVKGYVADNNKTFKLPEVKRLFNEALEQVTAKKWSNCVNHVIEEEKVLYKLDFTVEAMQLQFNVNTGSSSDESDCLFSD